MRIRVPRASCKCAWFNTTLLKLGRSWLRIRGVHLFCSTFLLCVIIIIHILILESFSFCIRVKQQVKIILLWLLGQYLRDVLSICMHICWKSVCCGGERWKGNEGFENGVQLSVQCSTQKSEKRNRTMKNTQSFTLETKRGILSSEIQMKILEASLDLEWLRAGKLPVCYLIFCGTKAG